MVEQNNILVTVFIYVRAIKMIILISFGDEFIVYLKITFGQEGDIPQY